MECYEKKASLWSRVIADVRECEWEEIKSIIGRSLIEENEQMHMEVETLYDIWKEYSEETNGLEIDAEQQIFPEPPLMRERLVAEIDFFLKNLGEQKGSLAGNMQECLKDQCGTNKKKKIISYILASPEGTLSRPSSSIGRASESSTSRPDSSCSFIGRVGEREEDEDLHKLCAGIEKMKTNINVFQIDSVKEKLVAAFKEEQTLLLKDIDFIQKCIDDEMMYRTSVENRSLMEKPSLSELREFGTELERQFLDSKVLKGSQKARITKPKLAHPVTQDIDNERILKKTTRDSQLFQENHSKEMASVTEQDFFHFFGDDFNSKSGRSSHKPKQIGHKHNSVRGIVSKVKVNLECSTDKVTIQSVSSSSKMSHEGIQKKSPSERKPKTSISGKKTNLISSEKPISPEKAVTAKESFHPHSPVLPPDGNLTVGKGKKKYHRASRVKQIDVKIGV
eukprot:Nk52_evm73s1810 gene=Nk52_evmTU73s1810